MNPLDTSRSADELEERLRAKGQHLELKIRTLISQMEQMNMILQDKQRELEGLHSLLKERDEIIKKQKTELSDLRKRSEQKGRMSRVALDSLNPDNPEALRIQVDHFIQEVDKAIKKLSE
ncbi:hypothetical protein BWI93_09440 [Siphonobacter sp. BAB-5385]|uniref:Uncharacterized protein n=2 Tax=Siphonobacter TaxID=700450 RepID=A0A2S7ILM1_9BACT|nr:MULTISPECIES: hypothetical protein [Siphonobacter]OZI08408.1 hypothetical protein BWI93_09440 [Siphonobacter sp. BAB-5385]PMD97137.1 hypothetical protein BWI97_09550 [Siphonobacter sp. BAB-5405]PQA58575.1 hypothetical protein C5O19_02595 [Siphonobacter curvatus]